MRLAAVLCAFIGLVQFFGSRSLFGLVWVVAAVVLTPATAIGPAPD